MMTQNRYRGITLIEVLVVIGIIALLVALLLPAVQRARESARRSGCRNQLHQIGLALHNYASQFSVFPPGGVHTTSNRPGTAPGGHEANEGRAPWTVLILPQLDEAGRYNAFNFNAAFSSLSRLKHETTEPNFTQQYTPLLKYSCPNDPNSTFAGYFSNYAACQGGGRQGDAATVTISEFPRLFFDNGIFFHNSSIRSSDITDGMSNTIMVGETKYVGTPTSFAQKDAWWPWSAAIRGDPTETKAAASLFNISSTVDPINFPQNGQYTEADIVKHQAVFEGCGHGGQQRVYGSWHKGGAHFLMADSSVHFLSENMDLTAYRSLGQRANGGPSNF